MLTLAFVAALLVPAFTDDFLDWERYDQIRDHVLPTMDEERWTEIPWRGTFWDGIQDARQHDRPVLLWAMNGHPLGCV